MADQRGGMKGDNWQQLAAERLTIALARTAQVSELVTRLRRIANQPDCNGRLERQLRALADEYDPIAYPDRYHRGSRPTPDTVPLSKRCVRADCRNRIAASSIWYCPDHATADGQQDACCPDGNPRLPNTNPAQEDA